MPWSVVGHRSPRAPGRRSEPSKANSFADVSCSASAFTNGSVNVVRSRLLLGEMTPLAAQTLAASGVARYCMNCLAGSASEKAMAKSPPPTTELAYWGSMSGNGKNAMSLPATSAGFTSLMATLPVKPPSMKKSATGLVPNTSASPSWYPVLRAIWRPPLTHTSLPMSLSTMASASTTDWSVNGTLPPNRSAYFWGPAVRK